MKVFLDDERVAPDDSWTVVKTAKEAIDLLSNNKVNSLSLDHDLGNESFGTGYDVLVWIEEQVYYSDYNPPKSITIHTLNPSARERMRVCLLSIRRICERKGMHINCFVHIYDSK